MRAHSFLGSIGCSLNETLFIPFVVYNVHLAMAIWTERDRISDRIVAASREPNHVMALEICFILLILEWRRFLTKVARSVG